MAEGNYQVLARKWRPQNFADVVGQEHISRTLQNAIRSGRIGHAFLFIGTRGVGKTTTARILAKALNCLNAGAPTPDPCGECANCTSIAKGTNIDVVEIDGASNNSVDHVREIRENIRMVPSSSRYKIYTIDEVHQLSQSAFNALLKTLEEPPEHAVFILATTESHKVPATIVSRCQRYDFRRVSLPRIADLLRAIIEKEGLRCSEEALQAIARAADGSVRDGESILEQLISYCGEEITFQDVFDVLGLVDWNVMHTLNDAVSNKDVATQLKLVDDVVASGKDLSQFVQDILRYYRNLLICKTADARALLGLPDEDIDEMERRAGQYALTDLIRLVEQFAELARDFDSQIAQRIALEALLIRISRVSVEVSLDSVLEKLARLGAGDVTLEAAGEAPREAPPNPEGAAAERAAAASAPEQELPHEPAGAGGEDGEPPAGDAPEAVPGAVPRVEPERVEAAPGSLDAIWKRVIDEAGEMGLNIRLAVSEAKPVAVEGETLLLRFDAGHTRYRETLDRPEAGGAVEAALTRFTTNLTRFRTELAAPVVREKPADRPAAAPSSGRVPPEVVEQVSKNPQVASVLEWFRGTVVEVRPVTPESPAAVEPDG